MLNINDVLYIVSIGSLVSRTTTFSKLESESSLAVSMAAFTSSTKVGDEIISSTFSAVAISSVIMVYFTLKERLSRC